MKVITQKLKDFREKKGLSQGDISLQLNMEQSTYSRIENGKTPLRYETALLLENILKVPEFVDGGYIVNNISNNKIDHSNIGCEVTYKDCVTNYLPEKMIGNLEEIIEFIKLGKK